MKAFNPKESSTWAGVAVVLTNIAGSLAAAGMIKPAAIVGALASIFGAVAAYIPDNKTTTIK